MNAVLRLHRIYYAYPPFFALIFLVIIKQLVDIKVCTIMSYTDDICSWFKKSLNERRFYKSYAADY